MSKLEQSPGLSSPFNSVFPKPIVSERNPTSNDKKNIPLGQMWVNKSSGTIFALSSVTAGSADWEALGGSGADVNTLTGDSGGEVSPINGTINILSGDKATIVGDPGTNTLTVNADAQISSEVGYDLVNNGFGYGLIGGNASSYIGVVGLVAGTSTINLTTIGVNDVVLLNRSNANASTALGVLQVTVNAGSNFIITSLQSSAPGVTETNDVSSVQYIVFRRNEL